MAYQLKQSSTAYPLVFLMIDSTDHITGKTGLSPTVTISKNGAAFAAPAGAVSEIANGWYKIAGNATDTATLGPLLLHATATGADPVDMLFPVVAIDPQSVNYGLSNLDAAISSRSTYAGADTAGTTTLLSRLTSTRATSLDNIDATISSRSTYAGGDTAGTTTLLGRLTATRAGLVDNLDATVSSRLATAGYTAAPTAAVNAATLLDTTASAHDTAGTVGHAINAAGTASDPWSTPLPGSYSAGTAGYLVGQNLDAAVSSRSTYAGGAVASVTAPVAIDQTVILSAPRDLGAVDDGSITVADGLWCAVAGAAGKWSIVGTTYLIRTPSTGTTIRSFVLDSASAPTSRS